MLTLVIEKFLLVAAIWIVGVTGWVIPDHMPTVHLVDATHMGLLTYADIVNVETTPIPLGLYKPITQRIYLNNKVDLFSVKGRALLIHEMVHHIQIQSHLENYACPGATELEAYTLENKWAQEQGVAMPELNRVFLLGLATCPSNIEEN